MSRLFRTSTSPHVTSSNSVTRVMMTVFLALIPGIAAYVWLFGWGVVINILLAILIALVCESAMLRLRGKPLRPFLSRWQRRRHGHFVGSDHPAAVALVVLS